MVRLRAYVHEEPNKVQRHEPGNRIRLEIVWLLINWETLQNQVKNNKDELRF